MFFDQAYPLDTENGEGKRTSDGRWLLTRNVTVPNSIRFIKVMAMSTTRYLLTDRVMWQVKSNFAVVAIAASHHTMTAHRGRITPSPKLMLPSSEAGVEMFDIKLEPLLLVYASDASLSEP